MASTKGLTHPSRQQKQGSPQIPSQPRPTTTEKAATTPSTKSDTLEIHIYQPPPSLRGWADDRDLEAPFRHLGLLEVARHKLPTSVPQPHPVSQLISSYDREKGCGYVWGTRVNVDRNSFLRAVSLHPAAERRDLPPNVPWSTVTRAAEQFINMGLRVKWRGMLPTVSAAMREVKAGSAHTVDWGKLMWDLVESEILELPKRDDKVSYFGAYLQRLIWVQLPWVFDFRERFDDVFEATCVKVMGKKRPIGVGSGRQPMKVQSSQLGIIILNDDVGFEKSDGESFSSPLNGGTMHTDGHNDHMEAQQQFQQGNQRKRAREDNNGGVPTGSAIAIANSSHDIAETERELRHATSEEGNQQKRALSDNTCSVPTRSAIAIPNSSHDIAEVERELKHASSEEQKRALSDNTCGVPAGSAIAIANSSHDIAQIEQELNHATSEELRQAETFIQVVKLLQGKVCAETIMHMFE